MKKRQFFLTSGLRFEDSFSDIDELVLIILGKDGKLPAQSRGIVIFALIRLSASRLHYVRVHSGAVKKAKNSFAMKKRGENKNNPAKMGKGIAREIQGKGCT